MIICPSVSPSVRPSVCPACRPPSSNLPSSPLTLLNEQTYIHDTQKCNFSVNFSRNWLNLFSFFTTYIKRVLSCDFQITLKNGNIDGGGRRMLFHIDNFENCLLLQLPINFYTVDARITDPICMIPLCIQMLAIYLNFSPSSGFEIFQLSYPKLQFLCELFRKSVKQNYEYGESHIPYIIYLTDFII